MSPAGSNSSSANSPDLEAIQQTVQVYYHFSAREGSLSWSAKRQVPDNDARADRQDMRYGRTRIYQGRARFPNGAVRWAHKEASERHEAEQLSGFAEHGSAECLSANGDRLVVLKSASRLTAFI